jgi:hypothetical protein
MRKWIEKHRIIIGILSGLGTLIIGAATLIVAFGSLPPDSWIRNFSITGVINLISVAFLSLISLIVKALTYKITIWAIILLALVIIGIKYYRNSNRYWFNLSGVNWRIEDIGGEQDLVNENAYCPVCNEELDIKNFDSGISSYFYLKLRVTK